MKKMSFTFLLLHIDNKNKNHIKGETNVILPTIKDLMRFNKMFYWKPSELFYNRWLNLMKSNKHIYYLPNETRVSVSKSP